MLNMHECCCIFCPVPGNDQTGHCGHFGRGVGSDLGGGGEVRKYRLREVDCAFWTLHRSPCSFGIKGEGEGREGLATCLCLCRLAGGERESRGGNLSVFIKWLWN